MSAPTDLRGVLRFVALHRYVTNLRRSIAFYCDGLGFEITEKNRDPAAQAVLTLGSERIVLTERTPSDSDVIWPKPASGPNLSFQHIAIVTRDMDAAFRRLQGQLPVAISRGGPQRLPLASGGVCAFKFRDPDSHPLELIEFPPGRSAARWHGAARGHGPTLGIDHAAISVSDIDGSIRFYRQLGFRPGSRQSNHGEEQARLDGLAFAEVNVATLLPADTDSPHLELLGYLAPEPFLDGTAAHCMADVLVWRTRAGGGAYQQGSDANRMVRADPDGHLNELV